MAPIGQRRSQFGRHRLQAGRGYGELALQKEDTDSINVLTLRSHFQAPEEFLHVINVNLLSLHLTTRAALPLLRKSPSGCGKVVLVSSGAAVGNSAAWSAYNASKAGANALIRTLATEEAGDKAAGRGQVAAFAVRPGVIDTDVSSKLLEELLSRTL